MVSRPTKSRQLTATENNRPAPRREEERVSRYDRFLADIRQRNIEAEANVKRLDMELAVHDAARAAMLAERNDWADIQTDTARTLNQPLIEGRANDTQT